MFIWTRGRIILVAGVVLNALLLAIWFAVSSYYANTELIPENGGHYVEGAVGQPVNLNPLVAVTDVDEDLNQLIFSGLTRIDSQGKIVGDLAQTWEVSEDRLNYTFTLRDDIYWHDGEPVTAEDVWFTVSSIQDANFPGPFVLRNNWAGVTVEVADERNVKFTLGDPYTPFLESTTLGIVPMHVLQETPVAEMATAPFNQAPIGSGPYRFDRFNSTGDTIVSVHLLANREHALRAPYIEEFSMRFYDTIDDVMTALRRQEIQAMRRLPGENFDSIADLRNVSIFTATLPQYQGLFFNTERELLKDVKLRQALSRAIDKQTLMEEILGGHGVLMDGPLPATSWAYQEAEAGGFDQAEAIRLLEEAGWTVPEGGEIRTKGDTLLKFSLLSDDDPIRRRLVFRVAEMWRQVGVEADVRLYGVGTFIENYLRSRDYDVVLFGQNTSWDPDVYAFWHSSQVGDPGMNISQFSNEQVDKLLEDARRVADVSKRKEMYGEFQTLIREQQPAVFLFSPKYYYAVSRDVKNVQLGYMGSPSDRFSSMERWYINTRRVEKVAAPPTNQTIQVTLNNVSPEETAPPEEEALRE